MGKDLGNVGFAAAGDVAIAPLYDRWTMQSFQSFAPAVLAEIIRRQPDSAERTAFAWSVAVGPALARVTSVEIRNRNLIVSARDVQWARELERSRDTILLRVQHLLGKDTVKGMYINA